MTKKNIYHLLAKHFQKIAHPDEEKLITVFREKNPLEYQQLKKLWFSKKDQLINFFRAISNYEFFDKVTRNDLKLIYSVFISAPNLEFIMNEHDTTVMQLPHEVSSFFRDWAVSEEGNYDDNISQLFSIPADNLKSNFLDQNGNAAEGVVGVFFPCHLFQN